MNARCCSQYRIVDLHQRTATQINEIFHDAQNSFGWLIISIFTLDNTLLTTNCVLPELGMLHTYTRTCVAYSQANLYLN